MLDDQVPPDWAVSKLHSAGIAVMNMVWHFPSEIVTSMWYTMSLYHRVTLHALESSVNL